jgi:acetylornithine deacetylase
MAALTVVELLERLVAFDTTSCNSNLPLADFVCNYLDRPGVRILRQPSPDGTKANLVVLAGPEVDPARRQGMVLSGHMDVVPPGETGWTSDPFTLRRDDGRLVARGACDMKGFLALALARMAATDSDALRHPLALLFTFDEEVGTLGARHFVESGLDDLVLPRRVIIGEPTGFSAVRMHKGHLQLAITVEGKAAHSGFPQSGDNAIEPIGRAVTALTDLRLAMEHESSQHSDQFQQVPFVTLNVARIAGGSATNVIPDHCSLDVGIRLLPGMTSGPVVERVHDTVATALPGRAFRLEVLNESPPMLLPEDNDLYRLLCRSVGQSESRSVYFATDAGWLSRADFDCVVFGPGNMDTAHKPDEWIPEGDLVRGEVVLEDVIQDACCPAPAAG